MSAVRACRGQEKLGSDTPGEGVRLVPMIVFVQRIVRLLNELGDDPSELLSDPNGLMRWYISNQFADKKEEKTMLLQAYEMRAVCILVDGVDEASGERSHSTRRLEVRSPSLVIASS